MHSLHCHWTAFNNVLEGGGDDDVVLALQQFRGRRRRRRGNHQLRKTRRARRRQRRPRHALTESAVVAVGPLRGWGEDAAIHATFPANRELARRPRSENISLIVCNVGKIRRSRGPADRPSRRPAPAPSTKPNERNLSPLQLSHSSLRHEKERLNFGSDDGCPRLIFTRR